MRRERWLGSYHLGVPVEGVRDAEDVVDHGCPIRARMEERRAVCAAEVHRREVTERAGQLRCPLLVHYCIHLRARWMLRGGRSA